MGQCGCADTNPDFRFPGPAGQHYGLEIYPSCHYCGTPVGVTLYRFADDDSADVWLDGVEELPFTPYDPDQPGDAMASISILGAEELAAAMAADRDDEDREVAEDDIRHALAEAVRTTFDAWNRQPSPDEARRVGEAGDG